MRRHSPLLQLISIGGLCLLAAGSAEVQAEQQDGRLDTLANEMALMKRMMAEQDRRLSALEQAIRELREESRVAPSGASVPGLRLGTSAPSGVRWHTPGNWDQVRTGMLESQVISTLGTPTDVQQVGSLRTLFYRGEVPGSGFVSGNVKLGEDRVYLVNKPVF